MTIEKRYMKGYEKDASELGETITMTHVIKEFSSFRPS
jgi:hypothetical protein